MEERRVEFRRQEDRELREMSRQAFDRATEAYNAIGTHEKVCAERFGHIRDDVKWVKKFIIGSMSSLIILLIGIVGYLITSGSHLVAVAK